MPIYRVELSPKSRKQINDLDKPVRERVFDAINRLATEPFPQKAITMQGQDSIYRTRAGDYRILYTVEHSQLLVLVVQVGNRREVYKR